MVKFLADHTKPLYLLQTEHCLTKELVYAVGKDNLCRERFSLGFVLCSQDTSDPDIYSEGLMNVDLFIWEASTVTSPTEPGLMFTRLLPQDLERAFGFINLRQCRAEQNQPGRIQLDIQRIWM